MNVKRFLHCNTFGIILSLLTALFISISCGEKTPKLISRPWINTSYRDLPDSILRQKMENGDTLAAMVLAWHYMDVEDSVKAAEILRDFNKYPQTASEDLNYLTARALIGSKQDSLALYNLIPLTNSKVYPIASIYLTNIYKKQKNFVQAIQVYKNMDKKKWPMIEDSILVCKAELGDSISAMKFAMKMLEINNPIKGVPYFSKYVSLKRGYSPPLWSYGAGRAYFDGNNMTRASVHLENADAETSFAELSYYLGLTYLNLEVYDSARSKLYTAMEMGDTSVNLIMALVNSYRRDNKPDQAAIASLLGISVYPDVEEFYFDPAKQYYEKGEYEKLYDLAGKGRISVRNSFKLDTYYTASLILLGQTDIGMAMIDTLISKYRYYPGALKEMSLIFTHSLAMEDVAQRMQDNDAANIYPETSGFLNMYNRNMKGGMIDSCRNMLLYWMAYDTMTDRRQFIADLYNKDFPNQPLDSTR